MGRNLRVPQRDQVMLLPVDLREWLSEDDLVWHVLDVVEQLDLTGFYARYRINGQGAAAYDPAMMLALTIYSHAVGIKSSRAIERACTRDAGFKVVTGLMVPDHCTIARFVRTHQDAVAGVFAQVLRLCHEAGMVRLGVIAVDGTKIAADASWAKSYTADALAHQVAEEQAAFEELAAQLVGQQVAIDEGEDVEHGPHDGGRDDDLPPHLRRRAERLERIKKAKAQLDERDAAARQQMLTEQVAKQAAYDAATAAGDRPRGPRPKAEVGYGRRRRRGKDGAWIDPAAARASTTDPDSRRMKSKNGFVQGYNAQTAVTADQIIVGHLVSQNPTDHHELPAVLDTTAAALRDAGIITAPTTPTALTAPAAERTGPEGAGEPDVERIEQELRTAADRDDALQIVLADAGYANEDTFAAVQDRGLILLAPLSSDEKLQRGSDPDGGQDLTARPATERGQRRLRTTTGKTLYKIRGRTAEPVFGHLKDRRGLRQFATRGLDNVTTEFSLGCSVHNIVKMFTHRQAPATA
jgi:transposase